MKIKNQEGWLAIEAMAAVMVMLISIPIFYNLWAFSKAEEEQAVIAGQIRTIGEAFEGYVQDNFAFFQASATPTAAISTTFAILQAGGYVQASISATNIWGQGYVNYVLQPKPGTLEIITLTTGGTRTDTAFLNQIVPGTAAKIGSKGGYVPSGLLAGQATTAMQGSYNGWKKSFTGTNITNPGAGHLAYYSSTDDIAAGGDFLYRKSVPGNPELNTMKTALNMDDNAIDNAGNITSSGNVTATGTVTAANGRASLYDRAGEGGVLKLTGANGVSMFVENLNGKLRLLNNAWNAELFSVDQSGNAATAGSMTAASVHLPGGNTLYIGNTIFYGDTANTVIKQDGALYLRHQNNTPADIAEVRNITSQGSISAAGNVTASGEVHGQTFVSLGGVYYGVSNNWGMQLLDAGWGGNSAPQSAVGSAHVNDIYLRSIGRWASSISTPAGTLCGAAYWDHSYGWVLKAQCAGLWPGLQGCPGGYTNVLTSAADANYSYSCSKN